MATYNAEDGGGTRIDPSTLAVGDSVRVVPSVANVVNNCLFGRGLTLTPAPRRRGWYVVEVAVERQGPSLPPELPNTDEDRAMRGVTR